MTSNHVLGLKVVLPDGSIDQLGGDSLESIQPDYVGMFVGSEGLFGIALEITLRLIPKPEVYRTVMSRLSIDQSGGRCSQSNHRFGVAALERWRSWTT